MSSVFLLQFSRIFLFVTLFHTAVHSAGGAKNFEEVLPTVPPTDSYDRKLWEILTSGREEAANTTQLTTAEGQRIAILTAATDQYSSEKVKGYFTALHGISCYCQRHNYTYILHRQPVEELKGLRDGQFWAKAFLIAKYLHDFDWVVWMDADVMIKRTSVKFEEFFGDGKDLSVADAPDGCNNGIFMIRNTAWARYFILLWFQLRTAIDCVSDNGPWMEALVRLVHNAAGRPYDDECVRISGGSTHTDVGRYVQCYDRVLSKLGSPVGARKHPKINFVYGKPYGGFNSGHGWAGQNAYKPGNFLIHFAGAGDKQEQMVKEAKPEWRRGQCERPVRPRAAKRSEPGPNGVAHFHRTEEVVVRWRVTETRK